jgi:hypothetical protein
VLFTLFCKDEIQATKFKLYNFDDFVYELKALIFEFKTGISQFKNKGQ